jgi:exonuclease SbcD
MTRLLHTADVHLRPDADERRDALETVLKRATGAEADVLTIGGDLFDDPATLEELRPTLRGELFSDRPFEIVLIPGNHDVEAFRGDIYFGDACTVLEREPFEQWTAPDGDLRITGIPYRETPDDELWMALQDRPAFDGTEALLLHCSLDAPFEDETGDEGTRQYFPVSESLLTELGFDLYLAGHYHQPHTVPFADDRTFVYPGTPASTTQSETGPRSVARYDTGETLSLASIETFHHAHTEYVLTPGEEDALLDRVEQWAENHAIRTADATVRVEGFTEMDETDFAEALATAAEPAAVTNETRSVRQLRGHPLYQAFEEELGATDWSERDREAVRQRTLAVFSELRAGGEL